MRSLLLALVLAAATAACGTSKNPSPPPDGGGTGGDGGGGSGGGGEPSGGGTGQPSGGEQPSGDGTTPPDSGGGSAGPVKSPDGTVTIERSDASAECDGLLPATAPSAVSVRIAGADPAYCGPGVSEGGGHVAVQQLVGPGSVGLQVFSPSGTPEREVRSAWNAPGTPRVFLFPQADGWISATATAWARPITQVDVWGLLPDGTPRGDAARVTRADDFMLSWTLAEDPRGGALFAKTVNPPAGPACNGSAVRFDASGAPGAAATFLGHDPSCRVAGAAVSREGETLVVESAGTEAWLHWFRADGTPALPAADEGPLAALFPSGKAVFLAPLLDGSIAASEDGVWTRRFPRLGAHAEAAPGWLASRPRFRFRSTRGERGYALLPPGGQESADCTQRIEVLAPSGRLCGTVTLSDPGGPCTTRPADQGWDGTVVQQGAREPWTWRWWPRLLGGG